MPRLLLLLGQSPFDPTSGAAQSTRLIAELAARSGYEVTALCTTACEGDIDSDRYHEEIIRGAEPLEPPGQWLSFRSGGIQYRLIRVDSAWKHSWEHHCGKAYDEALANYLTTEGCPQAVLTYGDDHTDRARRERLRTAGASIIFAVHNHAYRKRLPAVVDHFLFPTRYLQKAYGNSLGAPAEVLPVPLQAMTRPSSLDAQKLITFVNPEPGKGAILVAQLIDRLRRSHPDQVVLVVGGRVPAEGILQVGKDLNLDLSQHSNLYLLPPTQKVHEIWAETRLLLMPSALPEAAGRCALEAMLVGAVPCVSDQGGLREIVGASGCLLPSPPIPQGRAVKVSPKVIEAWSRTIVGLIDDSAHFERKSAACRARAEQHTMEVLTPLYKYWLDRIVAK
jgi:glycosyltransferase involved in cell wall biosynthesis